MSFLGWIILVVICVAVFIALAAWWYDRATNEVALLRTGIGGRRVVIDGGVIAIPYFHEISRINMQTLRLDVSRHGEASLITQDRLRVDVGAEFYVSVSPNADAITRAAQTLGKRTFQRDELRNLIDGMMVDALRSVAARMTMDELHENRAQFVADVRDGLKDTLARYGLQLDSVSLTGLDQTPFSALDENNAFNAVGMRKLAEVIAKSKKERAEIHADSEVSVRRAAMEASRKSLEIDLEERRAQIAQQQEIETLAAAQISEIARQKAESERASSEAKIQMETFIQKAEVERERDILIALKKAKRRPRRISPVQRRSKPMKRLAQPAPSPRPIAGLNWRNYRHNLKPQIRRCAHRLPRKMRNPQQKIKRRPFASWRPQKKPHRLPNRKPIARILRQKMPGLTI
ncbi:SPFH domain-containing protein [Planktomarina temperata]|nr:SPFH domain-containing protein [Planktomarina temperata]